MNVKELLDGIDYEVVNGKDTTEIINVCYDNRKVKQGDLFVCIKGFATDGHKYAPQAIESGAVAIICEDEMNIENKDVTVIKVKDSRKALAVCGDNFFDHPSKKMKMIGVTGTNGKTTTTTILKDILTRAGYKVGLIGTIANYIGNEKFHTERTTPESFELQSLFSEMVKQDVDYCVMEVSSHALALDRVYGIQFDAAIFTNLTRDHLDMHKTFEAYYKAKFKLFENADNCIINIDNEYGKRIVSDLQEMNSEAKIITMSTKEEADYKAEDINLEAISSSFTVRGEEFEMDIPGLYNVQNALGCIAVCEIMNLPIDNIKEGLCNASVRGRCEKVGKNHNIDFSIIVDYAHTPDGLENVLSTVKNVTKGRLIAVFGCGGNRDTVKRPQMGKIAEDIADIAIVTSDNPRKEEPSEIIKDILKGMTDKTNHITIENRYDAIKKAIEIAEKDDSIVIAGKGHEDYQILKDKTIHFDDKEVVEEILNKMNK